MHCDCGWGRREDRASASSALSHLLVVLRTIGMVPVRVVSTTPIDEELRRFDAQVEHERRARGRPAVPMTPWSTCGAWHPRPARGWGASCGSYYGSGFTTGRS